MNLKDSKAPITELSQAQYDMRGIRDYGVVRAGIRDYGVVRAGIRDFGVMTPLPTLGKAA